MDNNNLNNNPQNVGTYHATTNLNTAIENPQVNINSAVGVNIQNIDGSNNTLDTDNYSIGNDNNTIENNSINTDSNSFVSNTNNTIVSNNTFLNTNNNVSNSDNSDNRFINSEYISSSVDNDKVVYEPTLEEKKRNGIKITISKELKVMLFIVFVLVIFILSMPGIYEFFRNLGLIITG